jgi:hypothetical protein
VVGNVVGRRCWVCVFVRGWVAVYWVRLRVIIIVRLMFYPRCRCGARKARETPLMTIVPFVC